MKIGPGIRAVSMLIALAFIMAACSSAEEATNSANYVSFDDDDATSAAPLAVEGLTVTSESVEASADSSQATPDYSYVETLVQDFLDFRASTILHEPISDAALESVATGNAIDLVFEEQATNDGYLDQDYISALKQLATWPNITSIEAVGDSFVVRDCTERQTVNVASQFNTHFVDRTYTLVAAAPDSQAKLHETDLIISDFSTLHNGFLEPNARFGCVPQSFAERAETAAATAWAEVVAAARTPNEQAEFSSVFDDDLTSFLESVIADQARNDMALLADEDIVLTSIGIDTEVGLLQFDEANSVVVVESCRTFPTGLTLLEGDKETELVEPGEQLVQWIHVRIPTLWNSERPDQVVAVEHRPERRCGERS